MPTRCNYLIRTPFLHTRFDKKTKTKNMKIKKDALLLPPTAVPIAVNILLYIYFPGFSVEVSDFWMPSHRQSGGLITILLSIPAWDVAHEHGLIRHTSSRSSDSTVLLWRKTRQKSKKRNERKKQTTRLSQNQSKSNQPSAMGGALELSTDRPHLIDLCRRKE